MSIKYILFISCFNFIVPLLVAVRVRFHFLAIVNTKDDIAERGRVGQRGIEKCVSEVGAGTRLSSFTFHYARVLFLCQFDIPEVENREIGHHVLERKL